MNENLKYVAIFITFLLCVLLLSQIENDIRDYFNFKLGRAALIAVWATVTVFLFQLLNHLLSQRSGAVIYGVTLGLLTLTGLLAKFGAVKW